MNKIKDIMNPTPNEMYELMHSIGEKRFGSECKHENTKGGYCINCKRKVITKIRSNHVSHSSR